MKINIYYKITNNVNDLKNHSFSLFFIESAILENANLLISKMTGIEPEKINSLYLTPIKRFKKIELNKRAGIVLLFKIQDLYVTPFF